MMCKKYKHEFNDVALRNSKIWKVVLLALLVYFKLMKRNFWVFLGQQSDHGNEPEHMTIYPDISTITSTLQ